MTYKLVFFNIPNEKQIIEINLCIDNEIREVYKYINERIITIMDRDILREEIQLYNVSTEREINSNSTERIRDICNCLYYPSVGYFSKGIMYCLPLY